MKSEGILASTHLDSQGHRIGKGALESMAARVNSDEKVPLTVDHDITLPPAGKIVGARLEKAEDGEYLMIGEFDWFDGKKRVPLPDGTYAWQQESATDHHPFVARDYKSLQGVEIGADLLVFGEARERFFDEVRAQADYPFNEDVHVRKALVLDPEVVLRIGETIGAVWLLKPVGKKVAEKVSEEISDDAVKLYRLLRSAIVTTAKYALPKSRPITYVVEVGGEPLIQYVARTRNAEKVVEALHYDHLTTTQEEVERLLQSFKATCIQFLLTPGGRWKFNYLITQSGQSIGRPYRIQKRDRKLEQLRSGGYGMSIGGSGVSSQIDEGDGTALSIESSGVGQSLDVETHESGS